jgi:hypothetical protein
VTIKKGPPSRRALRGDGQGALCYWCHRTLQATSSQALTRATRDHIYPAWAGGTHRVWCCFACNNLKGAMKPNEWRAFMAANPSWWKLAKESLRVRKRISVLPLPSPERSVLAWGMAREIVGRRSTVG